MFILEVIPLTNLPPNVPQILSYFSDHELPKGAVVEVLLNKRTILAAVVDATPFEERKIDIKKAEFELKSISKIISAEPRVADWQFELAKWLAKTYYAPLGIALKTVVPKFQFSISNFHSIFNVQFSRENYQNKPLFLQTNAKDTLKHLNPYLEKTNGQILLLAPELTITEYFYNELSKTHSAILHHSGLSAKKQKENWAAVATGDCRLIIGTRAALFLPFSNLQLVIVEDPANEAYKSDMSPRYRADALAEFIARQHNAQLIFTSPIPSISAFLRIQQKEYSLAPLSPNGYVLMAINMVDELHAGNFSIFSHKVQDAIRQTVHNKTRMLIFSPRRGHSGMLLCEHCGKTVQCQNCSAPMRIHKIPQETLICHRCFSYAEFPKACPSCGSYKLKPTGPAGTQKIAEELRRFLTRNNISDAHIAILDTDLTRDRKAQAAALEQINEGPAFLIATHLVLSHRYTETFDTIAVMHTDALTSSPDFQADEQLFMVLAKLQDFSPNDILLQTYHPEYPALQKAVIGEYEKHYTEELEVRKRFGYPPFTRLVKLTFRHKDAQKASYASRIATEKLKRAIIQLGLKDSVAMMDASPAFHEREKNLYAYNLVLKISPSLDRLGTILKFVPAGWTVDVEPKSIL